MSPNVIALSLTILSFVLFVLAAFFWFPLWIRNKAGTAQALFLTNSVLAISATLKSIQVVRHIVAGQECENSFNITTGFMFLFVSVCQFALSKGYFNWRES
jgi:hypothetical protein